MALSLLRARIGHLVKIALLIAALLTAGAAGCGKKPAREPEPQQPAKTESGKTEKPKPKQTEKKPPPPALSDLLPVEGAGWDVPADPAEPIKGRFNVKETIAFEGDVVVPAAPSTFVAAGVPKAKAANTFLVYDLKDMLSISKRVALPPYSRLALSSDGTYLAARFKGKQAGVVMVWSTVSSQPIFKRDFAADKLEPSDVALVGKDRLWVAEPGVKAQLWGLLDNKQLPALSVAPRSEQRAFTPGGRYLLAAAKDDPLRITAHDLASGKLVGERRFEVPRALKGASAALAVSPDGQELAMLWRLARPNGEEWGRLVCWDLKTGKKLHEHGVPSFETINDLGGTGKQVVQFWPGRKGWMLYGHLLVDRDSGAVIRVKELGLPLDADDLQDRRFLGPDHVLDARLRPPRKLKIVRLLKEEIDEAVKQARAKPKEE